MPVQVAQNWFHVSINDPDTGIWRGFTAGGRECGLVVLAMSPPPKARRRPRRAAKAPQAPPKPTPELTLAKFSETPWVEFGEVAVGDSAQQPLLLVNSSDAAVTVAVDKVSEKHGFSIEVLGTQTQEGAVSVEPGEKVTSLVRWAPVKAGACRETLRLRLDGRYPLQAVLFGKASGGEDGDDGENSGRPSSQTKARKEKENGAVVKAGKAKAKKRKPLGKRAAAAPSQPFAALDGNVVVAAAGSRKSVKAAAPSGGMGGFGLRSPPRGSVGVTAREPLPASKEKPSEEPRSDTADAGIAKSPVAEAHKESTRASAVSEEDALAAIVAEIEAEAGLSPGSPMIDDSAESDTDPFSVTQVFNAISRDAEAEHEAEIIAEAKRQAAEAEAKRQAAEAAAKRKAAAAEAAAEKARRAESVAETVSAETRAENEPRSSVDDTHKAADNVKPVLMTFEAPRAARRKARPAHDRFRKPSASLSLSGTSDLNSSAAGGAGGPRSERKSRSLAASNKEAGAKDRVRARKAGKLRKQKEAAARASVGLSSGQGAQLRRVVYDENWADKQEAGFTGWLQHVFQPPSVEDHALAELRATPGNGHRVVAQMRAEGAIRRAAFRLYHSEAMDELMYNIDEEVAAGKLAVRADRELYADLGLRDQLTLMLMSYTPRWLRLGLETVFGEVIQVTAVSGADATVTALRHFISTRFLLDADIQKQFAGTKAGTHSSTHAAEQGRQTLRRFLRLVLFLDQAKLANVLGDHGSCLFHVDSEFKSSREMLLRFAKDFLAGEGNVHRHLSLLGYEVAYVQRPIDEFDFAISNIRVDLRDGVRLCRLVEVLAGLDMMELCRKTRVPAGSRLQKLHNVGLAMKVLESHGVKIDVSLHGTSGGGANSRSRGRGAISARDIVDGHREKTLALLWATICHWRLPDLVPVDDMEAEIASLAVSSRRSASALRSFDADHEESTHASVGNAAGEILLRWCQAVVGIYGIRVRNWTSSFADGRALCFLVHHYHPNLLKLSDVSSTSADLMTTAGMQGVGDITEWAPRLRDGVSPAEYEAALAGERKNFATVARVVTSLGCVPAVLPECDTTNLPEERAMVVFVAYMSSRLLESSREERAAVTIGKVWRSAVAEMRVMRHKGALDTISRTFGGIVRHALAARRARALQRSLEEGAATVQRAFRCFVARRRVDSERIVSSLLQAGLDARLHIVALRRADRVSVQASRVISFCRSAVAFSRYNRARRGVILGQALFRGSQARAATPLPQLRSAALAIQTFCRGYQARKAYVACVRAAVTIQCAVRRSAARHLLAQHRAALGVQTIWRGFSSRIQVATWHAAVDMIGAAFRGHTARTSYAQKRFVALRMQAVARGVAQRRMYARVRRSAIRLQRQHRRRTSQRAMNTQQAAAARIGATLKAFSARSKFLRLRAACVVLQCVGRFRLARAAAATVSRAWRGHAVRQRMEAMREATTLIRAYYVAYVCARKFSQMRSRAVIVQSWARMRCAFATYRRVRVAVIAMQSAWRGAAVRRDAQLQKEAAVAIQTALRGFFARTWYGQQRRAALVIQAAVRGSAARQSLYSKNVAATRLVSQWRGYKQRAEFSTMRQAAIRIAAAARGFQNARAYGMLRRSATVLAAVARRRSAVSHFKQQRFAACSIERVGRGFIARRIVQRHRAARAFQAVFRGHVARCATALDMTAASIVTCCAKGFVARRRFLRVRSSTVSLQCAWRRAAALNRRIELYMAAASIGAAGHGFIVRTRLARAKKATSIVQAHFRRHKAQAEVQSKMYAIRIIQRCVRGHQAAAAVALQTTAAATIQNAVRNWRLRRLAAVYTSSTVLVQRWYRCMGARRRTRAAAAAVVTLQANFRRQLVRREAAVRPIQRVVRGAIARARARAAMAIVLWLQAAWRGAVVRRRNRKRVEAARLRLAKANERARADATMTLGSRTSRALDVVLNSKALTEILHACVTLEVSTRLSRRCAQRFAFTQAAPVIIALIRSCNRSKPHQQLVRLALRILANVAGHDDTLPAICSACEGTDVLVDLLQMFRDVGPICEPAVKLLILLTKVEEQRETMASNKDVVKRLKSIQNIFARKHAMRSRGAGGAGRPAGRSGSPDEGKMVQLLSTLLGRIDRSKKRA